MNDVKVSRNVWEDSPYCEITVTIGSLVHGEMTINKELKGKIEKTLEFFIELPLLWSDDTEAFLCDVKMEIAPGFTEESVRESILPHVKEILNKAYAVARDHTEELLSTYIVSRAITETLVKGGQGEVSNRNSGGS